MSLAQVFEMTGATMANLEYAREVGTATRQLDGSEGVILLGDSGSGVGMGIALWRDQAAMQAAGAKISGDIETAKAMGIAIGPGRIYDTVISV
jgi:hypothetical protein